MAYLLRKGIMKNFSLKLIDNLRMCDYRFPSELLIQNYKRFDEEAIKSVTTKNKILNSLEASYLINPKWNLFATDYPRNSYQLVKYQRRLTSFFFHNNII